MSTVNKYNSTHGINENKFKEYSWFHCGMFAGSIYYFAVFPNFLQSEIHKIFIFMI